MTATNAKRKPTSKARPNRGPGVLTLNEAAAYLRVSEEQVLNLIREQGLAGRQIGGEWRFLKSTLDTWLATPVANGNDALLSLAGKWKDDPDVGEMLAEIYKRRGRPMTEDLE
jgi:excisionase family DNA binding protein